jgi:hypothetical protein
MKKIFVLLVFTGLFLTSCDEDLLTPFTPGALTDDVAVQTSADLRKLMSSSYNLMTDREDAVFTSVFTDEAGIGYANGGQGISDNWIFFVIPSSDSPGIIWGNLYFALSRINRVITYADRITPIDASDADVISRIKAEALTTRALCHLKIMSYFSPDPKSNDALAGILADRIITTSESNSPRATNGAFYTLIHSDLDSALVIFGSLTTGGIPTGSPILTSPTSYASVNLAKALKARAYALKGDYTNAEIWADKVISESGVNLAATQADYNKVFFTDNEPANTEVIFRLKRTGQQNTQGSNLHNGWCSVKPNLNGSPFYEVGRSLFNLLNANPLDFRTKTIVAPSSIIDPNYATSADFRNSDKLIIGKHGGVATGAATAASTATGGFNNDYKIVRISEMYLIKAEARVAAGDLPGAANAIDILRDKRFAANQTTPPYADATAAWKAILDERRIEFAFEGYRYIDIKRLGALAGISGVDRDPADYSSSSSNFPAADPLNLPLSSYKWALPIPQDELNGNPGIVQNPGYN